jgi:hypothetical protein
MADRELDAREEELVARARETAHVLYEGRRVAHRSCGIALAETFGLPTRPYQALRRGGVTGEGECGAIKAGELVLGELLGDPDPRGPVTPPLRAALIWYQGRIRRRLAEAGVVDPGPAPDIVCNTLTRRHGDFASPARLAMCTSIAAEVAAAVAESALRHGLVPSISPIPEE